MVSCAMPPHLVLPVQLSSDLGDISASQNNRDQLNDGQDYSNARVDDHHGDDIILQAVVQDSEASILEDDVADVGFLHPKDTAGATGAGQVAAAVRNTLVTTDRGVSAKNKSDEVYNYLAATM